MITCVVCDIEGTTTSLDFVHEVLFPISYEKIGDYLRQEEVHLLFGEELNKLCEKLGLSQKDGFSQLTNYFRKLIQDDVKDPLLKKIQGRIWKDSYEKGVIKGHLYPDVPKAFEQWQKNGIIIAIYSSGSVEAQKLLFQYSEYGNLTSYISYYFDISVGPKKEANSYKKIAEMVKQNPQSILFLSDNKEELYAANQANLKVARILRPKVVKCEDLPFLQVVDFTELEKKIFT